MPRAPVAAGATVGSRSPSRGPSAPSAATRAGIGSAQSITPPASERRLTDPLVVLSGVNKHFGALHVLKDIDLTVDRGEVVVVIGPSGSGKSTLCRTINRLETIDSGTISIDGKPLPAEGKALARLRADVGMVFQSFNLFAHKTVLENVMLGPVKAKGMKRTEAKQKALAL